MKKQTFKQFLSQRVIRFKRFVAKPYAAFCSMHRCVTIGQVNGYIANLEMLKAGKAAAVLMLLFSPVVLSADDVPPDDNSEPLSLSISEVGVVAQQSQFQSEAFRLVSNLSAEQIEALPVKTVSDLLRYLPGVDLRERGASGVQGDLSMRAGTAKQTKILLNGVDITDPQTEHYSMDIPVDVSIIERIELLQGTNYALDAFSGAINIITKTLPAQSDSTTYAINGSLTAGEYGLISPMLGARVQKNGWYLTSSASYNRSSGYDDDTDYKMSNIFLQTGYKGVDFQVGTQFKDAGANSFYTVRYPNQYDQTRTLISSLSYANHWKGWSLDMNAYYRAHFDRFHTYRDFLDLDGNPAPEWYSGPNRTWTHTSGLNLHGAWNNSWSKTSFGIDLRDEKVESSSLGNHNRFNLRYFAEERIYWRNLTASVGASGMWSSQFGSDWALGANIGYEPVRNLWLYLNFNRAIRVPTYTDLYYTTATQAADPNTRPESALQLEFSAKYDYKHLFANLSAYYRWGKDIIDWVKEDDAAVTVWRSVNHSDVNTAGIEATVGVAGYEWIRRAELSYSFADVKADAGNLLSLYALDYLRHKATFTLEHKIYKGFSATWCLRYEQREGSYTDRQGITTDYKPALLLDGAVSWANNFLRLSIECKNMTNRQYVDIGGVVQPPHWLVGKIEFKL